jgi:hypothetical protein
MDREVVKFIAFLAIVIAAWAVAVYSIRDKK